MKNKLLIVDDDNDVCSFYLSVLDSDYEVKTAQDGSSALSLFVDFKPDVVILDVDMPQQTGIEICHKMRVLTKEGPYVAIIFLSGNSSRENLVIGLSTGADDYLAKPCSLPELKARIKTNLRIKKITDELTLSKKKLQEENKKLEHLTITDELTGLYTMRFFTNRLEEEYSRACRYHYDISVIMLDLDHFKRVNDTCNHIMGSYVLTRVGAKVKQQLRSEDIAARYGGDEFVILLPHTSAAGALSLATRVADSVRNSRFVLDKFKVTITASIGIHTFTGDDRMAKKDSSELVRAADEFLYQAKDRGRDCIMHAGVGVLSSA